MLRQKTLFVIGAGASKEVRLPIGSELAEQIAKRLTFKFDFGQLKSGDHVLFNGLRRSVDAPQLGSVLK